MTSDPGAARRNHLEGWIDSDYASDPDTRADAADRGLGGQRGVHPDREQPREQEVH
eukprot:CAMPEP_0117066412 /NCGR_PEP_ID=MMETSP0472-20121206/46448_1 /TAXON_ID=693140 ORGANISM="Tiarina fusus, Strain LIS" /NCGR_SAMPLE_ID=MMETSP0472 /ASSEMBLY_ACC=CAM_ASM_000603 /LENGTH=55 /DNA_ID=CAMNT_0004787467 /DNA_START=201 /DNA_END=368 /DNA_ORIENTATION=+